MYFFTKVKIFNNFKIEFHQRFTQKLVYTHVSIVCRYVPNPYSYIYHQFMFEKMNLINNITNYLTFD